MGGMAKKPDKSGIDPYTLAVVGRTTKARNDSPYKTQEEMASALGIQRDRYATYETKRIIGKQFIARFCELTGISEAWLLTGEGPMKPPTIIPELMQKLSGLNEARQRDFAAMVELLTKGDK